MDPKCIGSVLQEYNDVSRRNYLYMSLLRGDSGFTGLTYKSEGGYNRWLFSGMKLEPKNGLH